MKYDLVFQGGGARGMVLVGAYAEFAARSHTPGRLLGTSAGAITATLIAAGYTPNEMLAALEEREDDRSVFAAFLGRPAPFSQQEIRTSAIRALLRNVDLVFVPDFIEERMDEALAQILLQDPLSRHLIALIERGGWYAADRFVSWLQTRLDSGTWQGEQRCFSGMTLAEFFAATGVELSVVASNTTDGRMLVLNHTTAPECPLVWAVRMSMSIPLLWEEVIWRAELLDTDRRQREEDQARHRFARQAGKEARETVGLIPRFADDRLITTYELPVVGVTQVKMFGC